MNILYYILVAVEAILCLFLVLIILVQKTKSGGGMGSAFGGGSTDSVFGSRAGNVLTKGTIIFGVAFLLNTLVLALIGPGRGTEQSVIERFGVVDPQAATPAAAAPAQSAPSPNNEAASAANLPEPGSAVEGASLNPETEVAPTPVEVPVEAPQVESDVVPAEEGN